MISNTYYYKVVIDDKDVDVRSIQNYIEEQIKNVKVSIYLIEDQKYLFFETNLQKNEILETLEDLVNEGSINYIDSSSSFEDDKIIVYFTMIPAFLQNETNFNTLIQSFLDFFKLSEIIPSILYCVRCQTPDDAKRLIAFTREIYFDSELKQKLFIDSNILNLPIMQVSPKNFNANYIRKKYNYNVIYSTFNDHFNILVFDTLENAESFSDKLNVTIFQDQMINIRHYVDNTTYIQLEKYQIRFKVSDLLQSQDKKIEDLDKAGINHECYKILRDFGKILSFDIDQKNHVNVIFENGDDAIKIVKNQKIKSQFANNSSYICGFPPDMTKASLKSILSKSSIILSNIEDYVLEPSDSKDFNSKKINSGNEITFPIFKLHFADIEEVEPILNKIKKINFDSFIPFSFRNKDDFKDNYNTITSNNTLQITGLPNNSPPSEVAKQCQEYGTIKLFLHTKMSKNSSAIVTFLKTSEFETAKKNLKQLLFNGSHLNVRKVLPKQAPDNNFEYNLIKKSTLDQKKQPSSYEPNKKLPSKQSTKPQEIQQVKKITNPPYSQPNNSKLLLNSIKIEKYGETQQQKQIKLEYNKPASLEKLKLEPLPPRVLKKVTLKIVPKKLNLNNSDEDDYTKEQKPDFM